MIRFFSDVYAFIIKWIMSVKAMLHGKRALKQSIIIFGAIVIALIFFIMTFTVAFMIGTVGGAIIFKFLGLKAVMMSWALPVRILIAPTVGIFGILFVWGMFTDLGSTLMKWLNEQDYKEN